MRPVSTSILIDVPRERVFDLLVDLSVRPSFTGHFMTEYRLQRLDPVGVGAAARFRVREAEHWMDTEIEDAERPHLIREHGHGGRSNRVPVFTVWELSEGVSAESCETTVTFWTEPVKHLDRIRDQLGAGRRFRRDWKRALARLREIAEDGVAVERLGVAGGERIAAFAR
jgi:uncharacterized protein YndB with AHSA1/START domain